MVGGELVWPASLPTGEKRYRDDDHSFRPCSRPRAVTRYSGSICWPTGSGLTSVDSIWLHWSQFLVKYPYEVLRADDQVLREASDVVVRRRVRRTEPTCVCTSLPLKTRKRAVASSGSGRGSEQAERACWLLAAAADHWSPLGPSWPWRLRCVLPPGPRPDLLTGRWS